MDEGRPNMQGFPIQRREEANVPSPLPGDATEALFAISEAIIGNRQQQDPAASANDRVVSRQPHAPFAGNPGRPPPNRRSSTDSHVVDEAGATRARAESETPAPTEITDLREAIRSRSMAHLERTLASNLHADLMAKSAANGAGLLMLAVSMGDLQQFRKLANEIKRRLGTKLFSRQLRFEDDKEKTLMFYAAASNREMFRAVKKLVRDTIGDAGLAEQLRHNCAEGTNVLMTAANNQETAVFDEVWGLLDRTQCLDELKDDQDKSGKNWVLYAAEAGNLRIFGKLRQQSDCWQDVIEEMKKTDARGWNGFMYAARGAKHENVTFLRKLREICVNPDRSIAVGDYDLELASVRTQLIRTAGDADESTMLMHAAVGGLASYKFVCKMMREADCAEPPAQGNSWGAKLLSWAAQGGDVRVLKMVAAGIKAEEFPDRDSVGEWYRTSIRAVGEGTEGNGQQEYDRILDAVRLCARRRSGVSLFLSAIESGIPEMMKIVAEGIQALVPQQECWEMLCGDGNPMVVAASKTVEVFDEALRILQDVTSFESLSTVDPKLGGLLLPVTDETPLRSAVYSEDESLFDHVLKTINGLLDTPLSGKAIISQVRHSVRDVNNEQRLAEKWISAKMLAKVLEAAKEAGSEGDAGFFEVKLLDDFVALVVDLGAFEHIKALLRIGCDLANHFRTLLSHIGTDEIDTTECMIRAVTSASNPFVECGVASHAIKQATLKRQRDHAALARLQKKIGELSLELIEHLPHSVNGVGEELARGDPDLEPFLSVGKVKPSELLGFVVVGWMLEGSGHSSDLDESRGGGGSNALAEAVRSGPRSLDLLSEALVLDYLDLKFSRTLPRWDDQNPFRNNINQAFYSYTHHAKKGPAADEARENKGHFQRLLLLLQGFEFDQTKMQPRAVFPGLQFILAGIMGKPVAYYVVPSIRMAFVVISYLVSLGLYLSCVSLRSQDIPANEWAFYVVMMAVAWREVLEFSNASKLEQGIGESLERYFLDKWNVLDVLTVGFVFVAFTFRMIELRTGDPDHLFVAQFFLATTAPLLSSRVLFLSQIGRALGPMTQVIFSMIRQLVLFSLVLVLVMLGFAVTFNALYGPDTVLVEQLDPLTCDISNSPAVEAFGTLGGALLTLFSSMLGQFTFEFFYDRYQNADGEDCGGLRYKDGGVVVYVLFVIVTSIMLLNLLIAVLSTAHAEVDQNASKESQLARAKIILQSGEDVKNDVLPPPFNLIKPVLGLAWPAGSSDSASSRWWGLTTGALHRLIFAMVVGLGAVALSTALWIMSFPLVAWKLSLWLGERRVPDAEVVDPQQHSDHGGASAHQSLRRGSSQPDIQPQWASTNPDGRNGNGEHGEGRNDMEMPVHLSQRRFMQPASFREEDLHVYVQTIFFVDPGPRRGATAHATAFCKRLINIVAGAGLAALSCFFLLPLLSVVLWLRGLGTIVQYVQQVKSKTSAWQRRQVDLGEDEEWSNARAHAITRNRRYWTAHSSAHEFNVDALLKTTTGLSVEDLRLNMKMLKSTRRQRALDASINTALDQFPSEENR